MMWEGLNDGSNSSWPAKWSQKMSSYRTRVMKRALYRQYLEELDRIHMAIEPDDEPDALSEDFQNGRDRAVPSPLYRDAKRWG